MAVECFFAPFSEKPCKGIIEACHLISKQKIKEKVGTEPVWDIRVLVPGCRYHHGNFDAYNFTVPREALPPAVEEFARQYGLETALDRRFGVRSDA